MKGHTTNIRMDRGQFQDVWLQARATLPFYTEVFTRNGVLGNRDGSRQHLGRSVPESPGHLD